jgi:hypothetical protein
VERTKSPLLMLIVQKYTKYSKSEEKCCKNQILGMGVCVVGVKNNFFCKFFISSQLFQIHFSFGL